MAQTKVTISMLAASTTSPLGVGTVELGHATDTTLSRSAAGDLAVEGNIIYRAGGTDVAVADGGTGASTAQAARASLSAASFEAGAALGLLTNPFFEISQENGTNLISGIGTGSIYAADQWLATESSDAVCSTQNIANPFSGTATLKRLQSSVKVIATTADASLSAAQYVFPFVQLIEGSFWRSLGWGTADARSVDVVFIAQCSVTGTYPVAIQNAAFNRAYVATVSLTANTPTVCFVTIPGDTGGTWVTTNAASAILNIGQATGTDRHATSLNTWEAADKTSHSSCTNWAASGTTNFFQVAYAQIFPSGVLPFTSAAQITGEALQLLLNMRRPYDVELQRCRRYFETCFNQGTVPADNVGSAVFFTCGNGGFSNSYCTTIAYKATKRTSSASIVFYNPISASAGTWQWYVSAAGTNAAPILETNSEFGFTAIRAGTGTNTLVQGAWTSNSRM